MGRREDGVQVSARRSGFGRHSGEVGFDATAPGRGGGRQIAGFLVRYLRHLGASRSHVFVDLAVRITRAKEPVGFEAAGEFVGDAEEGTWRS